MADLGWYTSDPTSEDLPVLLPAVATNSGISDVQSSYSPSLLAGVVGYTAGTVVWSTVWTPTTADDAPSLAYPNGVNGNVIQISPTAFSFNKGVLEINATLDGTPCTNGPLLLAISNGSLYGTLAWDHGTPAPPPLAASDLPELLAPLCWLAAGNAIAPDSLYDDFSSMSGHDRKRKVQTYAPRVVSVAAILEADEAYIVDEWFENVLNVGVERFTAQVAELGPSSKFWAAEWVSPIQWQAMALGRWRISGELLLTGTGEAAAPATVTLALEFGLDLAGSAVVFAPVELAVEFSMPLRAHNPFAMELRLSLTYPMFELREDGGFELREDGSFELRG